MKKYGRILVGFILAFLLAQSSPARTHFVHMQVIDGYRVRYHEQHYDDGSIGAIRMSIKRDKYKRTFHDFEDSVGLHLDESPYRRGDVEVVTGGSVNKKHIHRTANRTYNRFRRSLKRIVRNRPYLGPSLINRRTVARRTLRRFLSDREVVLRQAGPVNYSENLTRQKGRLLETAELTQVLLIGHALRQCRVRRTVGQLIAADLKRGITSLTGIQTSGTYGSYDIIGDQTEIGGLIRYQGKSVDFVPYEPARQQSNRRFVPSDAFDRHGALAQFHLHAFDAAGSPEYAGPSDGPFGGNDRSWLRTMNRSGTVITALGVKNERRSFNVDFYTPSGIILDLGRYSTPKGGCPGSN